MANLSRLRISSVTCHPERKREISHKVIHHAMLRDARSNCEIPRFARNDRCASAMAN